MKKFLASLFLACAFFPSAVLAWPGTIVSVSDGDTVTVIPDGNHKVPVTVRLYGIDAPELGQSFGQESAACLRAQLPTGQRVEVVPYGNDKYDRAVGLIQIGDHPGTPGRTLNGELVAAGLAWVYYPYCQEKFCKKWYRTQKAAAAARRGLWADTKPEKPARWRKRHPRQPAHP